MADKFRMRPIVVVDLSQSRRVMSGTVPGEGRRHRRSRVHAGLCASVARRTRLYPAIVNSAHIWLRSTPRYLILRPPPTVFTQPNTSSTRLRTR